MQTSGGLSKVRGWTLIEACACVAVASILAGSAVGPMHSFLDGRRLEGMASELTTYVHHARSEAVARSGGVRLSFLAAADGSRCTLMHTGPATACSCSAGGVAHCNAPDAALLRWQGSPAGQRVNVEANVVSMHFDPVRGAVSPAGTIRTALPDGREVRHVVSVFGRVRSCSPEAKVPGYKAC